MADRVGAYFVSDVHLGLKVKDPAAREASFVGFLRSIPKDTTRSLYLLGDIWDFWYEYRDVVPKGYVRVFSSIMDLIDAGVEVYFMPGNHDIWCYHYFEELGMRKIQQPCEIKVGDMTICIGHGDGLGMGFNGYKILNWIFKNRAIQWLFSLLHPWIAFRLGNSWSKGNRLSRGERYHFRGEQEPLYKFAAQYEKTHKVDCFIFGHYHDNVDMKLPGGSRLLVMRDWLDGPDYLYCSGMNVCSGHFLNKE